MALLHRSKESIRKRGNALIVVETTKSPLPSRSKAYYLANHGDPNVEMWIAESAS